MSVRKLVLLVACCLAMTLYGADVAAQSNPVVIIETSLGTITAELDRAKAPISVENFMQYVADGHYNGTIFHRVIKGFMVQGGGFTADMQQKPVRAPIKNEATNGLKNAKGTLAMARTNVVDSATSQFFINTGADNGFSQQHRHYAGGLRVCGVRKGDRRHGRGRHDRGRRHRHPRPVRRRAEHAGRDPVNHRPVAASR